ncbi:hypothetical protein CYPRO_2416 [Cyclonatronum proteinivorum]|uniref:ParB-like nuclease domain-containing protein n=1 Tax=Cyclonatronum proteinivorum TaxID=1457365 RepID=A0A345UMF6_9BACT|nr:hypothetical protein [Cyclonatronum proteinivorum]AXJ01658.1 hypothetical protein CYPRO_2416 [Cyclonatronum proteinivorum]
MIKNFLFKGKKLLYSFIGYLIFNVNKLWFKSLPRVYSTYININPFDIKLSVEGSTFNQMGGWRLKHFVLYKPIAHINPLREYVLVLEKTFEELYVHDTKPNETAYFHYLLNKKTKNDAALDKIVSLKNKYRVMFEQFGQGKIIVPYKTTSNIDFFSIGIGAQGELYFMTGNHRLAIARALKLEQIPASVAFRHKDWQKIRESIYKALKSGYPLKDELRGYLGHPDIVHMINDHTLNAPAN